MPAEIATVPDEQSVQDLKRELAEAREQQAATAQILATISNSPTDPKRVFADIAASAARLCDAFDATIHQVDGGTLRLVAHHGPILTGPTMPLVRGALLGRAVLERREIEVADLSAETTEYPEGSEAARHFDFRTTLAVPLIQAGNAIGVIVIRRTEVRPFSARQVELLKIFADQAVIAIETTRHFDEVQARTKELQEALKHQTATSEVLNVISRSKFDLQPVLDTIVETAARLCFADMGSIRGRDGDAYVHLASYGVGPEYAEYVITTRHAAGRGSIVGRVALEGKAVQIVDVLADPEYTLFEQQRRGNFRTVLGIPLVREGAQIGIIILMRRLVEPFSEKQIELGTTFADQAVIAIENTRLFEQVQARTRELTESLEQQTATSEVLSVISSSPTDVRPVLDAIVKTAATLCSSQDAVVLLKDGTDLRITAHHGPMAVDFARIPIGRDTVAGRSVVDRVAVHVHDLAAESEKREFPLGQHIAVRLNQRTVLGLPLLREGEAIGCLFLRRTELRPFTEKQIALLQTFADQAVIAIENTRLFEAEQTSKRELQESLDYQTAISEVLSVISRSPSQIGPVMQTIANTARRLCQAERAIVWRIEAAAFRPVAFSGMDVDRIEQVLEYRLPLGAGSTLGRAAQAGRAVQVLDTLSEPGLSFVNIALSRSGNVRTVFAVPLLRDGHAIGGITLSRTVVAAFTDPQIALVETFADQAVIAIENARLLEAEQTSKRDLQESLEYQTATSDVLDVISRSPTDVQPVFAAIAQSAARLCKAELCNVFRFDGRLIHIAASHVPASSEAREINAAQPPIAPGRGSAAARAIATKDVAEVCDVDADPDYQRKEFARAAKMGSTMAVPMLQQGVPIGAIAIGTTKKGTFPARQVELLRTFADQAVIAIQNTRLFEEVQARTRELSESLEYQTATAEVLGVLSRSPTDVQPVFDAIAKSAAKLCDAFDAVVLRVDGDLLRPVAHHGPIPIGNVPLRRGTVAGRSIIDRRLIHVEDLQVEEAEYPEGSAFAKQLGPRTTLSVPLLREGVAIGNLQVRRDEVQPFSDKQIALLQIFADQAVIAIENARLFEEVQARNRDLTALGEVGRAVSSTLDLKIVLKTIVDRAVDLSGTDAGSIYYYHAQAGSFELGETAGLNDDLIQRFRRLDITATGTGLGEAILKREPLQIADLNKRASSPLRDAAIDAGLHASLIVPLLGSEGPLGALVLQRRQRGEFLKSVVSLMQSFADQSAIALENARLFNEIAQKGRELEIASQHKSQFVANMSHELRTPLAAILGYAELMQEGFYEPQGPKSLDALTRIRSNGKHLLGLINTVLDIAKIESGQFSLNLGEYAIENVVETVRAATEALAETKKLGLKTELAVRLPVGVGDEQRLTQVLLNLVGNAIKFTDSGEVRISATAVNSQFDVRVTDTGPGVPIKEQKRIFEQFHQVDSSNTQAKGGTGLGLAIAKQIVEMHGGRIWVESTPGKGATFRMELPVLAQNRMVQA